MLYGVAHYPELWPRDVFLKDLELMKRIKLNVVRIAEFSWSLLEPVEGKYSFDWLHELVDVYSRYGIKVIIGTPTAAPPPWLIKMYPEVLPVDYNGVPARYGVRREYCPNNKVYRVFTERIVSRIADEFKNYDNVIGFQIDNEVHWGEASSWRYCYCSYCVTRFREYLKAKYGDIDNLNNVMGTLVWSHKFNDFDEITPPKPPFDLYNRSLTIEWIRFRSWSWTDYVRFQVEIIKKKAPNKFVTTNLMGLYPEIDYYDLCEILDFCSTDVYPKFGSDRYDPAFPALIYDATRNMSRSKKFVVMELQAGATDGYSYLTPEGVGVFKISVSPEPGEIRKWAYQAVAHGAEGILFWDWRTRPIGKEQFWHGVLDHDGVPRRRFYEVEKLFNELSKISGMIDGTEVRAEVAILMSYDSLWALDTVERGYYEHTYMGELIKTYKALWLNRVAIDVISPNALFDNYKVIVAPSLYLADDKLISKLKDFVYKGGILVLTPRAFTKDGYNKVRINTTDIQELTGLSIKEYTRIPLQTKVMVKFTEDSPLLPGEQTYGEAWLEVYEIITAKAIAHASWNWISSEPVIAINNYGKGRVLTVGTCIPMETLEKMLRRILIEANIMSIVQELHFDPNMEYYARIKAKDNEEILFMINHENIDKRIRIKLSKPISTAIDLLTNDKINPENVELVLKPHDVKILLLRY